MTLAIPGRIETARLVLRRLDVADAAALLDAVESSRPELERWIRWPTRVHSRDDAEALIRDAAAETTTWTRGIFRRDDGHLVGGIDARVLNPRVPALALGYWLRTDATGHGSMREAVRALTGVLFNRFGARRVVIGCDPANRRSARVAEACGFVFEARLRNEIVYSGHDVRDLLVYSMIDTDAATRGLEGDLPAISDDTKPEET